MTKYIVGIVADFEKVSGVTSFLRNSFMKIKDSEIKFVAINISGSNDMDEELIKLGWSVEHIVPANLSYRAHLKGWINLLMRTRFSFIYFNYSASWNILPVLLSKFFCHSIIAMHAHNVYFGSVAGKFKMKVLTILHKSGKKLISPFIDMRFSASEGASEWLFPKKDLSLVQIINNGVDLEKWDYNPTIRGKIRQFNNVQDMFVIINVGVLEPRKNQSFLLNVFFHVHEKNANTELWIFGKGSLIDNLKQKVLDLGLEDCVCLWGSRNNIESYFQAADVFVMPSVSEGLSVAYIEAQASALPVVINKNLPLGTPVNRLIHPQSLNSSVESWVQEILSCKDETRTSSKREMQRNGYDSRDLLISAEKIIEEFKELYEQ